MIGPEPKPAESREEVFSYRKSRIFERHQHLNLTNNLKSSLEYSHSICSLCCKLEYFHLFARTSFFVPIFDFHSLAGLVILATTINKSLDDSPELEIKLQLGTERCLE